METILNLAVFLHIAQYRSGWWINTWRYKKKHKKTIPVISSLAPLRYTKDMIRICHQTPLSSLFLKKSNTVVDCTEINFQEPNKLSDPNQLIKEIHQALHVPTSILWSRKNQITFLPITDSHISSARFLPAETRTMPPWSKSATKTRIY